MAALMLMGCGGETGSPRARLFASSEPDPIEEHIKNGTGIRLVFSPDLQGCAPQQTEAIAALEQFDRDFGGSRVLTAVPFFKRQTQRLLGHALPGEIVIVPSRQFLDAARVAPLPRIEAWSADGRLLLLKSLPASVRRENLYDELLWIRSLADLSKR